MSDLHSETTERLEESWMKWWRNSWNRVPLRDVILDFRERVELSLQVEGITSPDSQTYRVGLLLSRLKAELTDVMKHRRALSELTVIDEASREKSHALTTRTVDLKGQIEFYEDFMALIRAAKICDESFNKTQVLRFEFEIDSPYTRAPDKADIWNAFRRAVKAQSANDLKVSPSVPAKVISGEPRSATRLKQVLEFMERKEMFNGRQAVEVRILRRGVTEDDLVLQFNGWCLVLGEFGWHFEDTSGA